MREPTPNPSTNPPTGASPLSGFDAEATLGQRLSHAARANTGGVVYVRSAGEAVRQSYAELFEDARRIAAGLIAAGVRPGEHVLLQLENGEDFIPGLWGCIVAGAIPTPVAVAPTFSKPNSALQKLLNAGLLLEQAPVLASGAAVAGLRALPRELGALRGAVLDLATLRTSAPLTVPALPARAATDVAVLLLTSGSTGQPKGVPLTHRNLLAMSAGTIEANGFTAADVTLNWMALDHVGAVSFLGTMATDLGCTQIHVPTGYILQEPLRWLELIARHRATISWAPNFAFTLFLDREEAVKAGNWDLRSMRFLVNAGEAVVARTARRFIALLQRHGLPAAALRPAFGMSETCSGITWSRGLTLENTGDEQAFVDLGPCIPGAEMRVVDEAGDVLPEGETGVLQLRGPSVFGGYFRNAAENAQVFRDGWFTTGDLAFLRGGCLHIAGRQKDVIIVNGANFQCHEIETVAEAVSGVRKTFTAACAVREAAADTDQLALFFCLTDDSDAATVEKTARAIRTKLIQEAGVPPAYLIALDAAAVPKTEIGKIQRAQLKKAFEAGAFRDRVVQLARSAPRAPRPARGRSRGELAPAIAAIWQDVLGVESVGYDETFFELGGHSLLVVQVQARLQELIGRPIPVVELFNFATVRALAGHFAAEFDGLPASAAAAAVRTPGADGSRDIAIIGIGLRFPGASSPAEFWQVLAEGRETIRFFTAEDALAAGVDPALVRDPNHVKAAPMLDAPEAFDAEFFRYTAREARMIDPQQRVFLEVCWEAFEDAGYDPLSFPGKVGLFAAAGMNTYLANNLLANETFLREENGGRMLTVDSMNGFNIMITNDKDYLPTRVSYKLNLRGPSINVQTACSSTLLTLHEACNAILMGDCEMALAGGVSIKLPQHAGHVYSAGMLNSPDGHCRAYDAKAEGTIFGNGAGVVLIKPLAAALADGDRIYAVVKATATNNDGAGKVGFTAPSATGEEEVCAHALARAGVSADSVTFMEGHGTGTPLGDPIEVNALASAFRRHTGRTGFCALGSVKTNVGHLQIASGIAGLIKTTLALHHRAIPATLHFDQPNPRIDFATTPFFVNRETLPWESAGGPRRAGVNSLGIGGTNVHAILEEAPAAAVADASPKLQPGGRCLLPLSTRHPDALRQLAGRYADFLDTAATTVSLDDIAYTAQVGRATLPVRAAFAGGTREELGRALRAFAAGAGEIPAAINFDQHGPGFAFAGEGEEAAMGRALYADEPVFRAALDRCAMILDTELEVPFLRVLWDDATPAGVRRPIEAPEFARSALFAFQHALAELLGSYGIEPACLVGLGAGEYAAACRAGVFSLEDGLRLAAARGRLDAAFSREAALGAFRAVAESVSYASPDRKLFSGFMGSWVDGEIAEAGYWVRHAQAEAAIPGETLAAWLTADNRMWVEVGPRAMLRELVRAKAGAEAAARLLAGDFPEVVGTLFTLGYPVQWSAGRKARPGRRVALPTYPWQHHAYWIEGTDLRRPAPARAVTAVAAEAGADPLLGRRWQSPRVREIVYETRFDLAAIPYLAEHRVHDRVVTPGALYLAQVARQATDLLRGARGASGDVVAALSDVVFVRAMVISPESARTVQTVFTPDEAADGSAFRFEVLSWDENKPEVVVVHATGVARASGRHLADGRQDVRATEVTDLARLRSGMKGVRDVAAHYAVMDAMAVRLGPSFRWISEIRAGDGVALLRLEAPRGIEAGREWHPGLVDSFLQATVPAAGLDGARTRIPFSVERVVFHAAPAGEVLFAHAERRSDARDADTIRADVRLYDAEGALLVEALGFELRGLLPADLQATGTAPGEPECFDVAWERLEAPSDAEVAEQPGAWLVLSDGGAIGENLSAALKAAGATVVSVLPHQTSLAEDLLRTRAWCGVVYAWSTQVETPAEIGWKNLLACVRAAAGGAATETPPRWIFLTEVVRGAAAQAPLGGFAAGLAHEFPEWRPLHVELETDAATNMESLVPWLLDGASTESRIALRADEIRGARLVTKSVVERPIRVRAEATYLITGGAGALGLAVADWLVAKGARSLLLAGRRAANAELNARIAAWTSRGVRVDYARADVSDGAAVRALVAQAEAMAPLRGVFHAAGSVRDGLLRHAEPEAFASVFGAKMGGAWELHRATRERPLDCFVLFSSIASLLGSPAQTNYAAANAFLDGLAVQRQREGLPALSIQWGPWDQIGMSARLEERDRRRLQERGLRLMAPAAALQAMDRLLGCGAQGCVGVFAWERERYRRSLGREVPAFYRRIFKSELRPTPLPADDAKRGLATLSLAARTEAIERLIREAVASILGLDSYQHVERGRGLFDLGIDSLTSVDLKNRLEKTFGQTLRTTIAFDYPTAAAMAAHLATTLFPETPAVAAVATALETDALDGLSAAELEDLLEQELKG